MAVWLLSPVADSSEPMMSPTVCPLASAPFILMTFCTDMEPSVMVPVLSRHSTLTRASISRE